jgi:hypothetical protein
VYRPNRAVTNTDTLIPSLVRALEDQVAKLESQVASLQPSPTSVALAWTSKLAFATLSATTTPLRPFFSSSMSPLFFLRPSCPPFLVARIINQSYSAAETVSQPQSSAANGLRNSKTAPPYPPPTDLTKIPSAALEQMVWNYTNIHLPQYPCVQEHWLHQTVTRVLQALGSNVNTTSEQDKLNEPGAIHFELFVVYITLAISSLTLTWRNEHQARSASNAFFSSSLHHLRLTARLTEIQSLQISLLLAHYASMNPVKVDNRACLWNASRIVIQLGLHKHTTTHMPKEHTELRKQLFWVTYGMERSLCSVMRLPLSFSEESITETRPQNPPNIDAPNGHHSAHHLYRYRALETEVHRVLNLQDELAQGGIMDLHDWVDDIARRLDKWLEGAQKFSKYQMLEFHRVQHSYLKARIYGFTPRLETRSPEARTICFDACLAVIDDYQRQAKRRRLFYPWNGVHILFEAAIIMLESCWALRDHEALRPRARHVLFIAVPDCLALLAKMGESWRDSLLCSEYLGAIVDEISRAFRERELNYIDEGQQDMDKFITDRLRQLLYPKGASSWSCSPFSGSERAGIDQSSLPEDFNYDGFENFNWLVPWNFLQDLHSLYSDSTS